MRLDELISKKDKYKSVQHTIGKRPQAKEQTTNHKAAPLPGVFLGEESILYTGKIVTRVNPRGGEVGGQVGNKTEEGGYI